VTANIIPPRGAQAGPPLSRLRTSGLGEGNAIQRRKHIHLAPSPAQRSSLSSREKEGEGAPRNFASGKAVLTDETLREGSRCAKDSRALADQF